MTSVVGRRLAAPPKNAQCESNYEHSWDLSATGQPVIFCIWYSRFILCVYVCVLGSSPSGMLYHYSPRRPALPSSLGTSGDPLLCIINCCVATLIRTVASSSHPICHFLLLRTTAASENDDSCLLRGSRLRRRRFLPSFGHTQLLKGSINFTPVEFNFRESCSGGSGGRGRKRQAKDIETT